jgi:tRNA pseudouridine38-40 synthase
VVHADLPDPFPSGRGGRPRTGDELRQSLNRQLGPSVVVQRLEPAPAGFDARRAARSRRYRYLIWNAPQPDPLLAPVAWHRSEPLDLRMMQAGADALLGEHDFRSFCRRPPGTSAAEPIVRRVLEARWSTDCGPEAGDAGAVGEGRLVRFDIEASSFCHQMVRSIVALLAEAGAGRQNTASVVEALRATTRDGTPAPAPPHGLCLTSVSYKGPEAW